MNEILVVLHLNFKNEAKAETFLNKLLSQLESEAINLAIAPYTKFKNQYRAEFKLLSQFTSDADRVYEMLQLAYLLVETSKKDIKVIGPSGDGEQLQFEIIVNSEGIISWAHLQLEHA